MNGFCKKTQGFSKDMQGIPKDLIRTWKAFDRNLKVLVRVE